MKTDSLSCGPLCGSKAVNVAHADVPLSRQIHDFFTGLLDTDKWPARWHCGEWSDFHGWLYLLSDLGIWAAYFAIPLLLIHILVKRKDVPFYKIFGLFIAFILLCGLTHLIDAMAFWWPAYRFSAVLRFATAIVSMSTVYALYRVMPMILNLRSVSDLQAEIEKRRIIEEKLAASEFLLSEAGRISRVGGWELDVANNKRTWSKSIYDIFELPYDSPIDDVNMLQYFPGTYYNQMDEAITNAYNHGGSWDMEVLVSRKDGTTIWARSIGEPFFDEEGKLIKLRGVFMDIDRYKVNELALSKSLELLTQNNQQLKNFTHILSHNIRNHASNISLISSLIDTTSLTEDNADLVDKIKSISGGLNDTLNDLSEAIKIKDSVIQSEKLGFEAVTLKVMRIIQNDIRLSEAVINMDFKVEEVNFPPIYLESIILNLLTNTIKYRSERSPVIELRTYKDEKQCTVLECRDNGRGIDLKLHGEKIFGLYKTFHDTKNARGVGLFLVKTQVESQGGSIQVESTPGEGSVFKIIFNE
ncbi:hypothetical protein EOD41_17855 [Mucilaginibacter limnophilus]|uniref:histidine kinase n=1 Tax=Mucilaginibacter limnophilus TaxID=1932778 RepID=A0A3S2WWE7_9SPHI|nr:ATP-binding protein [Mucilaginibacter limnophilus]RVT98236.1 hypothetical protein EOD41_17855 [Mucilaginibacter limnophilus]